MLRKTRNVVMLPTEKASNLCTIMINNLGRPTYYYNSNSNAFIPQKDDNSVIQPQHLYLTAPDEEIKVGDWFIDWGVLSADMIPNVAQALPSSDLTFLNHPNKRPDKIIATTNPELWSRFDLNAYRSGTGYKQTIVPTGIAKIDTDFIKAYVKAEGKIDKVLVEYDGEVIEYELYSDEPKEYRYYPKLNVNGAVKVYRVEEKKYTREEFKEGIKKALKESKESYSYLDRAGFDKWFDKNYPI